MYMGLYKSMAAGNLPRAGGETCRKIEAHVREKKKQKTKVAAMETKCAAKMEEACPGWDRLPLW